MADTRGKLLEVPLIGRPEEADKNNNMDLFG
jgi:hypothetical protein